MKITKKVIRKYWHISIDGKKYRLRKASEILGLPFNVLKNGCSRYPKEEFQQWVEDTIWKLSVGASPGEKIHQVEGKPVCASMIMKETGVCRSVALNRISKATKGIWTWDEMMQQPDPTRQEIGKGSHNEITSSIPVSNMQPRKTIFDLKPIGSWEKNLPEPKNGMSVSRESRGIAFNDKGKSYLQGD